MDLVNDNSTKQKKETNKNLDSKEIPKLEPTKLEN